MKKFILGLIIGLSLVSVVYAYEVNVKWYIVDTLFSPNTNTPYTFQYQKTYDEDTNVVCYALSRSGNSVAISCLKNN